jgi:uncharacterized protein YjbI with pentapeptide repeats
MLKRWAALPPRIQWLVGIAVIVLALAVVWALFVPVADWLAHHDVGSAGGSLHETAVDNARGRLLTLGAGLFAAGALVFTARNFTVSRRTLELTEQGQVTDRYTKAIEQLGSDKGLDVRIGGIYALERVARDSAIDHPAVMEVLAAFIREHSHEQWPPSNAPATLAEAPAQSRSTRPDVQAALTVVGRRDPGRDTQQIDFADAHLGGARLTGTRLDGADLRAADLTGARLDGAHLHQARLDGAHLRGANLHNADLREVWLNGADLTGAYLPGARLNGAHLRGADLTGADLFAADLREAWLDEAHVERADLRGAHLEGALLEKADLTGANLYGADLEGADLNRAHLTNAELDRAHFTNANLRGADLTNTNLNGADLTGADLTGATFRHANLAYVKWPEGAEIPEGWKLDPGSGWLDRARTSSGPAEAN